MWIQIIILFVRLLILPGYFIYELWKGQETSKFKWLIKALYSSAFLLYIFMAGRWDWLSYYLRFVWIIFLVLALFISYRRVHTLPLFVNQGQSLWRTMSGELVTLLLFLVFLIVTIRGYFYAEEPVRLTFPLRDGWYYVGQGGNILLVALGLLFLFHILVLLRVIPADIVWGGRIQGVPANFIVLETIALLVTLLFMLIVAAKVGYIQAGKFSGAVNIAVWFIFIFLVLNTLGNLVSGVSFENLIGAPITILLAFCALRLALEK